MGGELVNFIARLFGKSDASTETLCPYCERAIKEGHKCAAMSRRFFFGAMAGGAVLAAAPQIVTTEPKILFPPPADVVITDLGLRQYSATFCIMMKVDYDNVLHHNWGLDRTFVPRPRRKW